MRWARYRRPARLDRRAFADRRALIRGATFLVLAGVAPGITSACGASGTPLRNRSDIDRMGENHPDLLAFRCAYEKLKANQDIDSPYSLDFHVRLHIEHCCHANWFFLPWHRALLTYFERICGELSNRPDFALPYWNWGRHPKLPSQVRSGVLSGADRYDDADAALCDMAADLYEVSDVRCLAALGFGPMLGVEADNQKDERGYSLLEQVHVNIHNVVGTVMSSSAGVAPRDPVFWLHHANVDRLWSRWLDGVDSQQLSSAPAKWREHLLDQFWDPRPGSDVRPQVSSMLDHHQLGYGYDDDPPEGYGRPRSLSFDPPKIVAFNTVDQVKARSAVFRASTAEKKATVRQLLPIFVTVDTAVESLMLVLGFVVPDGVRSIVDVYVRSTAPNPNAGEDRVRERAGIVSFFMIHGEHAHESAVVGGRVRINGCVSLDAAVRRLGLSGSNVPIEISFEVRSRGDGLAEQIELVEYSVQSNR